MFGNNKYKKEIGQLRTQIAEFEFQVSQQNEMFHAMYEFLSSGMALGKDSKLKDYVREGYEGNPDLFSIITKLAGMFAAVPLYLHEKKGKEYERIDNEKITWLKRTNYYQNWNEFKRHWIISAYVTGNMIVYSPKLPEGVNRGRINKDGLIVMPSQNTTIKSAGWRKPIGKYVLDINQTYEIDPSDVWHERFAPTLNFEDGKNFMGQSPVKVAKHIINSQNKGYEITSKMYEHGHPPGVLYKEDINSDGSTEEQESKFRERYRAKYQGVNNITVPIFTLGKTGYTKIGYDNLQELQIINMSEHGRRVFCNLLGVPAQLFNDMTSSIYNNFIEASKTIYTNRIIPDINTFCEGINEEILSAYGDVILKPDFSKIEALQEEKAKKVEWVSKMWQDGIITGDQYLEMLGEEPTGDPEMQIRYIAANRIPIDFAEMSDIERSNKFYEQYKIPEAM
jgi:HK97 family phage portal protein